MNMKRMDVYLNYQVVVMSNLQKFKDQILKQNTPHKSMCLELVLWEISYLSAKNEDVCLEISMLVWEGC